jgi:uncharacterized protein involved in response to NO
MLVNIENPPASSSGFALWQLGFRPFFLFAGIFSVLSMALWMHIYVFNLPYPVTGITLYQWHAHEMIYGYSMAVIAGFLLTAVRNWTNRPTASGKALIALVALWAAARIAMLFGDRFIAVAAAFDLLFMLALMIAVAMPIVEAKQWKQLGVLSKLVLLLAGNLCFYLGALGMLLPGAYLGIYGGLLLVVGLILMIGRRVIPFFIERGVGYDVQLRNPRWLDITSMLLFFLFFIIELFAAAPGLVSLLGGALFVVITLRLYNWHTPGIWKKPLLWSLYVSLLFIDLGFLMFAFGGFLDVPRLLAIHAFAVGGIGLVTLSMMSRVSLGHTGRDIGNPSVLVGIACLCLIAAAVFRVIVPTLAMGSYPTWIMISQILWIAGFALFVVRYLPILIRPRVDGRPG